MIGFLRGILQSSAPGQVLIDVAGVGYHARVSFNTYSRLPDTGCEVSLHVLTSMRENALELFAFLDESEKELFTTLRSVSGIGPRMALAVLSAIQPAELARAVLEQDVATLVAVPGVGRKTAERLLVELKGKVEQLSAADHSDVDADAVAALLALGYRRQQAGDAVRASRPDAGEDLQGLIRMSLKRLSA